MKSALLFIVFAFLAGQASWAQTPDISDAPKAIQELAAAIQGKSPAGVRAAIIKQLGPAQRDIGSGLLIEQWDTAGGVLTFHPYSGPTFFDPKSKVYFHLMRTTNPVGSNLFGDYEMTTLPDPKTHGSEIWLGNVKVGADLCYHYTDTGQFPDQRITRDKNFFMLNPAGKVEVRYVEPLKADTLLESVSGESTVAHLIFTSADGKSQAAFSVTTSGQSRYLECGAKGESFRMGKHWDNFWK
jgi:hypothetical protein